MIILDTYILYVYIFQFLFLNIAQPLTPESIKNLIFVQVLFPEARESQLAPPHPPKCYPH